MFINVVVQHAGCPREILFVTESFDVSQELTLIYKEVAFALDCVTGLSWAGTTFIGIKLDYESLLSPLLSDFFHFTQIYCDDCCVISSTI
jgi:hypothetical protein